MSTVSIQPSILHQRLSSLRKALARWFMMDALARVSVAALLLVFISLGLDRTFGMDRPQRAIMLGLMLMVLGWILWSRLIRPLVRTPDDEALCRIVERRCPAVADAMTSALQLARLDDPQRVGASPELVRAAVRIGELHAADLNFLDTLNLREQRRNLWRGGTSLIALVAAFVVFQPTMTLWAQRNILLQSTPWPQRTHLRVPGLDETGTLIVPRGDDLVVRVEATGVVPQMVHLDVKSAASSPTRTQEMIGVGDPGAATFEAAFTSVLDPFLFRVRGGDAATDWHAVQLVDRPQLQTLELHVTPPAYTQSAGGGPRILSTGQSIYDVPAGSTLVVSGVANKPLASAQLLLEDQHVADLAVDPDSPECFAAALGPDQLQSGAYGLSFVDAHDLHSRRPARFVVRVDADDPPVMRAELSGIGEMITPRARIPLRLRCSDDYAVTEAAVIVEHAAAGETQATRLRLPLPALAGLLPARDVGPIDESIDLQPLGLPTDAGLGLFVELTDNDAVTGPKTAASAVFSFKIVTDDQLRAELLRRETEQRMEFERLLVDQRQLHTDTLAFIAELGTTDRLTAAQWRELSDLEKTQRLAAGRCMGVAMELGRILAEVINNRLEEPDGPLQTRLAERVIAPLNSLADDALPAAADAVEAVRRTDVDAEARRAGLNNAADAQRQIIAAMELVLANMVRMEGYQEAINQLRQIIGAQEDVEQRTIKALEKRIEDIFSP